MNSFLEEKEIKQFGFKKYGTNLFISKKCSIYNPEKIKLGNNIRIDDFCILSGEITIKDNVHISAHCSLYGSSGIIIGDYSGISPGCTIFSATDDFSGNYMVGPMVPNKFRKIIHGKVVISNYVQIGANSIIMPSVKIGTGSAVGAFSLVKKNIEPWKIYFGIPAKEFKNRSKKLLKYVKQLKNE